MGKEYWQTDENPHISRKHWAHGIEKDADYELSENNTLTELRIISTRLFNNNFLSNGIVTAILNANLGGNITIKVEYPTKSIENSLNELLGETLSGVDEEAEVPIEEFLELLTIGALTKGDILINPYQDPDKTCGFSLELIEANRIRTPDELMMDLNIIEGVEYETGRNRVKGFWIRKLAPHLMDLTAYDNHMSNFTFLPKYKKLSTGGHSTYKRLGYLFRAASDRRPNQTRGKPPLTSIMGLLRYISQYFEALLISMRVSACFCGILNTKNMPGTVQNLDKNSIENMFQTIDMPPGQFLVTEDGTVSFSTPSKPSDNISEVLKIFFMLLGMALRYPYPILFLDMKEVNYTSYRSAALEMRRMTKRWHNRYEWVMKWLVIEAIKSYKMKGLVNFSLTKVKVLMTFPEFESLDPEKEGRGEKIDLANGTTSQKKICEKRGIDYDSVLKDKEEYDKEMKRIEAEVLKYTGELEKSYKIIFPENKEVQNRSTKVRQGETVTNEGEVDEEDKKERRKEDGNW